MGGGWAEANRSTVRRVCGGYDGRWKGLVGPWSNHYGFNGRPGPSIGFLQEARRWWDAMATGRPDGGSLVRRRHLRSVGGERKQSAAGQESDD